MMKRNILSILSIFLVASLFVMSSVLALGPPTLSSIPEQTRWVADGTTQYKVKIVADNGPMQEITRAVQFQYNLPEVPGYQFNVQGVTLRPQQNDFFAGFNTDDFVAGNLIGRLTFGGGPMNVQGNVVYLWVTVTRIDATAGPRQAKFTFNDDPSFTMFIGANGKTIVSPTLISQPFVVVPQGYAVHPNGPTGVSPEDPVKARCSQVGSIIRNRC